MEELFSAAQVEQLQGIIRSAMHEEFKNVGLLVSDDDDVMEARKDFSFVRYLRQAGNRIAQKVGWAIIALILSGIVYIVKLGVETYLRTQGHS